MQCHIKVEKVLSVQDLVAFLRKAADELERGELTVGDTTVGISRSVELKEMLELDAESVSVDLRVRYRQSTDLQVREAEEKKISKASTELKPSFKKFKKRLAKTFKSILDSLNSDQLPSAETVGSFCADAEVMTTFLGKGDEHYAIFLQRCRELAVAVEQGNVDAAKDVTGALNQIRKDCHALYK